MIVGSMSDTWCNDSWQQEAWLDNIWPLILFLKNGPIRPLFYFHLFYILQFNKLMVSYLDGVLGTSVTRLCDLLHFGQVFKAFGSNQFAQIATHFRQFL